MQFYWSWKTLPEFQMHSRNEFRLAIWQVGLKPFRHWQVWAALISLSTLMLLWVETIFSFWMGNSTFNAEWINNLLWLGALLVAFGLYIPFRHIYFSILRSYIPHVIFSPAGSWWSALIKSKVIACIPFMLMLFSMLSIDWIINYYDESLDPRFATIKAWPQPIPDNENGFVAHLGLMAPLDSSFVEVGRAYMVALNQAIANHTEAPTSPQVLKYARFVSKLQNDAPSNPQVNNPKPRKPNSRDYFCLAGKESCWNILYQERKEVTEWLNANKVLLARYQSLRKYTQWQNAITVSQSNPISDYAHLMYAQSLLQATAMLAIERGQVKQGLELLGDDISFVKLMLEGKDTLLGKMIANVMLTKDLALLSETLQAHPKEFKRYEEQIEKMVYPLTAQQVSVVDAFRFEDQFHFSAFDGDMFENFSSFAMTADDKQEQLPGFVKYWASHHFKKNASLNMLIRTSARQEKLFKVRDVNATKPIASVEYGAAVLEKSSMYFNQLGQTLYVVSLPSYNEYVNKLFDLNALNNLVHLQITLITNNVNADEVQKFITSNNRSLWNPETVRPFDWDAQLKQIYFVPSTAQFKEKYRIGGVKGRLGFSVQ